MTTFVTEYKSFMIYFSTDGDVAVRVWSGNYSIDAVKTNAGKEFRLINLPFYLLEALPLILQQVLQKTSL